MIQAFHPSAPATRRILGWLLVVMLFATLLIASLGYGFHRNNLDLLGQVAQAEQAARPFLDGDRTIPLPALLAAEQRVHESLQAEWDALVLRVDTFDAGMALFSGQSGSSEEGRIDFKVALYNARTNLQQQARLRGRTVPEDLGMRETISADETAEVLLWQLATVVRFMEQAIELGIPEIERIAPLPPTVHRIPDESVAFAREFPLQISVRCSFAEFYQLVDTLLRQGTYFALRRFELVKASPDEDQNLSVRLVYAGEVFDVLTLVAPEAPSPSPSPSAAPALSPDRPADNQGEEPW